MCFILLTSICTWFYTINQIKKRQKQLECQKQNNIKDTMIKDKKDDKTQENMKKSKKRKKKREAPVIFSADTYKSHLNPATKVLYLPNANVGPNLLEYYTAEQVVDLVVHGLGDLILHNRFFFHLFFVCIYLLLWFHFQTKHTHTYIYKNTNTTGSYR